MKRNFQGLPFFLSSTITLALTPPPPLALGFVDIYQSCFFKLRFDDDRIEDSIAMKEKKSETRKERRNAL